MVAFTPTPETITLAHMMVATVIAIASTFGTWIFLKRNEAAPTPKATPFPYHDVCIMIKQALQKEKRDAARVEIDKGY